MSTAGEGALKVRTAGIHCSVHGAGQSLGAIFRDVSWSPSYIAFLVYIFVIVTYRFPIGEVAMAVALFGLLVEPGRFRLPPFLLWLAAFLLWALVGYDRTTYPVIVRANLDAFVRLWLLALVAVNVLKSRPRIRFFLVFFVVLFVTHPVRGALFNNYMYGYNVAGRLVWTGIFNNPNDMAVLTLLPIGIAAGLASDPNRWIRLGARISVPLLIGLIFMTQSRGGLLALGLFGLLAVFKAVSSRRRIQSLAVVAIVAVGSVVASPQGAIDRMESLVNGLIARDLSEVDEDNSALQRYTVWKVARQISREHPLFGVGLRAYSQENQRVAARSRLTKLAGGYRDAHSTYLSVLAETGFPGLFIFLSMILHTLLGSRRARRKAAGVAPDLVRQSWFLESALLAYLVAGVFGTYGQLSFLYIQLALLASVTQILGTRARQGRPVFRRPLSLATSRLQPRPLSRA